MACAVVNLSGGGTAIVCGLPKAKRCKFCGEPGETLCDWPVERMELIPGHKLRKGDRALVLCGLYEVIFCQADISKDALYLGLVLEKTGAVSTVEFRLSGEYQVRRTATCDAPCCEAHAREVGDDRHYCADHWRAWEEIS